MKKFTVGLLVLASLTTFSCGGNKDGGDSLSKTIVDAKNTTLASQTYVYEYSLKSSVKFAKVADVTPVEISGKIQHSNVKKDGTNHFEKRVLSGALVFDATTYKYNNDNAYITVSSNEKKDFSVADANKIPDNYDFEGNCVGKVFKSLENNGNIKTTKEGNKYKVTLKPNFASNSILSFANFLDSGKVIKLLNKYLSQWSTSVNPACYITLSDDNKTVKTFDFSVDISIKSIVDISLSFNQSFSKINEEISFEKPTFKNTEIEEAKINNLLTEVNTCYDNSKNSYYAYTLKTAVDHGRTNDNPLGLAVNSKVKGLSQRKYDNDKLYFYNKFELDSDYKNKDQYPEYAEDYTAIRANVKQDYKVYDKLKTGILFKNPKEVENYNNHDVDDYYMLPNKQWFTTGNVKIMRKETKDSSNTYKFGITQDCIKNILKFYNKTIRLDMDEVKWIDVFSGLDNFNAKKADFIITTSNNKIDSIELEFKGFYDMSADDDVKFSLSLNLNFDHSAAEYEIPNEAKDIK